MRCILLENTNPYFCLAAEEYLLKNFKEDIFMLWQSSNTIVVGKHQNALGEINYSFVRENDITVARRISGGGTVFHDEGNVNFSYIKNVNSPAEISFKLFTGPIVEALSKLGLEASTSGRNDLLISGEKISGNAEHVFKNRVLHHGTLLFNSDLKNLGQAIKVVPGKYQGKAIQSIRSEVANISSFLRRPMKTRQFVEFLLDVQLRNPENKKVELNETDILHIQYLAYEKFNTWEWNYGYSPKYSFRNEVKYKGEKLSIKLDVKKGLIENCELNGTYFTKEISKLYGENLIGKYHQFESVKNELEKHFGDVTEELIYAFF